MKTGDLIAALALDLGTTGPRHGWRPARRLGLLVTAAMLLVSVLFLGSMGLRSGLSNASIVGAVALKQAIALTTAAAGILIALRAADPVGIRGGGPRLLLLPAALLALAMLADLGLNGVTGWQDRLVGHNGLRCVIAIPLLGLLPLTTILAALRDGTAPRPSAAGALAGLAAAGLGAAVYALNCTDDSPLFVAVWYSIAASVMAGVGSLAGQRALRW